MTPSSAIQDLQLAEAHRVISAKEYAQSHKRFGRTIATNRKVSRSKFAQKLGVTGSMLALMEGGKRRWPMARAKLAVRLLTRREDWPD